MSDFSAVEKEIRGGSLGGGFFCFLAAALGWSAQPPQPFPILWYRTFALVATLAAFSCFALRFRMGIARWSAIGSLSILGLILCIFAIAAWNSGPAPAPIVAGFVAVVVFRSVFYLQSKRVEDYFRNGSSRP